MPFVLLTAPAYAQDWDAIRKCESGGNYSNKANPTYRGAYQFDRSTWASVGGTGDPADASPAEQDQRAQRLYNERGSSPWPACGRRGSAEGKALAGVRTATPQRVTYQPQSLGQTGNRTYVLLGIAGILLLAGGVSLYAGAPQRNRHIVAGMVEPLSDSFFDGQPDIQAPQASTFGWDKKKVWDEYGRRWQPTTGRSVPLPSKKSSQ